MANLRQINIPPPYNGLNTVAPPGQLPTGTGPLVRNFLVDTPGKLSMRGPITDDAPFPSSDIATATSSSLNIMVGAWKFNNTFLLGFADLTDAGTVPPWQVPHLKPNDGRYFDGASSTMVHVDLSTGTATAIRGSGGTTPRGAAARLGNIVYGFEYGGGPSASVNATLSNLLRWDGTRTEPTAFSNAPYGGQYVKAHLSRLFVLGGTDQSELLRIDAGDWSMVTGSDEIKFHFDGTDGTSAGESEAVNGWNSANVGYPISGDGIPGSTTIADKWITDISPDVFDLYIRLSARATKTQTTAISLDAITIGDANVYPNRLYYSDQGGPLTDSIVAWQDDATGLLNQMVVGDDDLDDYGVALAVVNQALIVFKRNSIWALYGYSPSTFQIRNLTKERGCLDPGSVCEVNGGVLFMSQNGIEFYDGSAFITMDGAIANVTRPFAAEYMGEAMSIGTFGRVMISYLGNDHIMLTIAGQIPTAGASAGRADSNNFTAYMHVPSGNWSQFTSDAIGGTNQVQYIGRGDHCAWVFDGANIFQLPYIVNPALSQAMSVDSIDNTTARKAIPAKFWTDRIALASPGSHIQMHRYMLDYKFPNGGTDGAAVDGWYVKLVGGKGESILDELQVPGQAASGFASPLFGPGASSYVNGRRFEKDIYSEALDLRVELEWKTGTAALAQPEVYNSTIEFQEGRQRRST